MTSMTRLKRSEGNVLTYILIGIFLLGLLTLAVSEGPKKSAVTMQLDKAIQMTLNAFTAIEASVNECTLLYPTPVDINANGTIDTTDNPNAPYPLVYIPATGYANAGNVYEIICPGMPPTPLTVPTAPDIKQYIFNTQTSKVTQMMGSEVTVGVSYVTSTTEGVYFVIQSIYASNPLWVETVTRVNASLSACKAAVITTGGTCTATNPCLYYWIKRPATSTIGMPEAGCTL